MRYHEWGTILKHTAQSKDIYVLELSLPRIGARCKPGQFIHLRVGEGIDPLLRRPFSVYRVSRRSASTSVHVLYRTVGKGTRLLSRKKPGERLDVLGPLGNGFTMAKIRRGCSALILVAGGMGIAPLVCLAEILRHTAGLKKLPVFVYTGTDTAANLMAIPLLKKLGCRVRVATEDGSAGVKGYVTTALLADRARLRRYGGARVIACGPLPMLCALQKVCRQEQWPGEVSVDEMMGCGVGACLGCVIRTRDTGGSERYQRICRDGPVFDIGALIPEEKE